MQTERLDWLDIAKAIAIMLVVYGHASRGLEVAGLISFEGALGYVDYLIYTVHMPVFFVISGFLYERSREPHPRSRRSFWVDKVVNIAWPYLLWTTIHVISQTAMSGTGATNNDTSLTRLLSIGWDPVSPFWFLYALFVAFTLSFVLHHLPILAVAVGSFVMMLATYSLDAPQIAFDLTYGLVYFTIGRLAYAERLSALPRNIAVMAIATVGFLSASFAAYALGIHVRLETIGTLFGLVAFFILARVMAATTFSRPLVLIGRCTMGIYVMHIIVIAAFRYAGLNFLHIGPSGIIVGCTVLAVLLPLTVQIIANLIGVAKFVGLKTKLDDVPWLHQLQRGKA